MPRNSQKIQVWGAVGWGRAGEGLQEGTAGPVAATACLFGFREVAAAPGNPVSASSFLLREENVTVPNGTVGESSKTVPESDSRCVFQLVLSARGQGLHLPRPQFPCRLNGP